MVSWGELNPGLSVDAAAAGHPRALGRGRALPEVFEGGSAGRGAAWVRRGLQAVGTAANVAPGGIDMQVYLAVNDHHHVPPRP